jgi:hypothetical protein
MVHPPFENIIRGILSATGLFQTDLSSRLYMSKDRTTAT